jgi:glycerol-3-phosphate dehydrogenase
MKADVVIIGAGIVGTAIARELSRYNLRTLVVEKEIDVACSGATKANTGLIHPGEHNTPGSLMAKLCVRGNSLWPNLASELDVPFKRIGCLVVALAEEEVRVLHELKQRGQKNRVPGLELVEGRERLFEMEPNLNQKAVAALYAPGLGVTSPYEMAIALMENAAGNGVNFLFEARVEGIEVKNSKVKGVRTTKGNVRSKYVINAAGLYSDEISATVGIDHFTIHPRKGEYFIFDKELGSLVKHAIFPIPTPLSKGIKVIPTVEGNLLVGPTAQDIGDKTDTATTANGLRRAMEGGIKLVPSLAMFTDKIIANYAGVRAVVSTDDFVVEAYDAPEGFINAAGVDSPGLTAAPAIAEMVLELLREKGLELKKKKVWHSRRRSIDRSVRELSKGRVKKLIASDASYGHVVCRCEHVTEGEIVEAIRRGAKTLDGIKYRTRAGMGRCQGGFCTPRVIKILARELGIRMEDVTKRGKSSKLLFEIKSLSGVGPDD